MTTHQETTGRHVDHGIEGSQDSTVGLTVIAFLLALILGFSAADQHAPGGGAVTSLQQEKIALDGRGKWGGYLK